jgi:ParB family chromosome partitioning protein
MAKQALGKGLKALIPDEGFIPSNKADEEVRVPTGSVGSLPVEKIKVNPFQPRKDFDEAALEELKNSIIENGIIQPVTVSRDGDGYQLISGERRLRAVRKAGFKFIPGYIVDAHEDAGKLELALIENIQREDLNAIEIALALKSLVTTCNLTQDEIAQKVGKNRSTISNFLRLLKLPTLIQNSIREKDISSGHARALINLPNQKQQIKVWKEILRKKLSVRQTEELVNKLFRETPAKPVRSRTVSPFDEIESRLRERFATKVRIVEKNKGKGEIHIQYFSPDDLERILEIMNYE